MRDIKSTLAEAHVIPIWTYDDTDFDDEDGLPDISSMIPEKCVYTPSAIKCGIRNLDSFIQEYLNVPLKWETIILIFGNLSGKDQDEIIANSDCDTDVRESIAGAVSLFLTGKHWPSYGTSPSDKETWHMSINTARKKYSR